jgi:hypothetical protein
VTTPTALPDLLAAAPTLDDPERSFSHKAKDGNRIVARAGDAYKVTVDFDGDAKQYWLTEKNADAKGAGRLKKRLTVFLQEHGWTEKPELTPTESRWIIR